MEEQNPKTTSRILKKSLNFDVIANLCLVVFVFLIPLFFIPRGLSLGSFDKPLLLIFGTIILSILWIVARLKDGKLSFQKTFIAIAAKVFLLTLLVSAIASPESDLSFFGYGYEMTTFFFIFLMIILMFITSHLLDTRQKINKLFSALVISGAVLFIVQLVNIFFNINFFGLGSDNQTLVGAWNNLALFFGLMTIFTALQLSEGQAGKRATYYSIGFILSLFALFVTNFTLVWILLLSVSILYAVFRLVKHRASILGSTSLDVNRYGTVAMNVSRAVTWPVILIFVVSILFLALGRDGAIGTHGGPLNRVFNSVVESPFEIRPSAEGTLEVYKRTLALDPLSGAGLNRFSAIWREHKPESVRQSAYFWNTEFFTGHSYLTTIFSTTGILGLLGTLAFFLSVLFVVLRGIVKGFDEENKLAGISLVTASIATLYLWIVLLLYVPSPAIVALTFVVTGMQLAMLKSYGIVKNLDLSKIKPQVYGFASVLALVLFAILNLALGFSYTQKVMAWNNFSDGVDKVLSGDIEAGYEHLGKATSLDERDLYFRIKSETGLLRLGQIINQEGKSQEELVVEFEQASSEAFSDAVKAIEIDPGYYLNYLYLAKVYINLIPYGVKAADTVALQTYDKAKEVAPKNPVVQYEKALLFFGLGREKEGVESLAEAISLKSNYTDALFLRSQIAIRQGKLEEALADTYQAVSITPTDIGLLFQLGFLQYRAGDYSNAGVALARAVELNSSYSNARYFLGLTLNKLDRKEEAIEQFKVVLQLNPDHQGVIDIIENLEAGRDPFVGQAVEDLPEEQEEPPIDEDN